MSLTFDLQTFQSLFPDSVSDKNGTAIKYTVEDSDYRIYNPTWSSNNTVLTVNLDHIRSGATDDHATLIVTYDSNAGIESIEGTWTAGNDGYTITKIVITAVDASAEFLGAVGALETVGISEAVANGIVEAFDTFCELFNTLSPIVVNLTDNGGRFYFMAVVCHTVNRMNASVTAS